MERCLYFMNFSFDLARFHCHRKNKFSECFESLDVSPAFLYVVIIITLLLVLGTSIDAATIRNENGTSTENEQSDENNHRNRLLKTFFEYSIPEREEDGKSTSFS